MKTFAAGLMDAIDLNRAVLDTAAALREDAIDRGFSPTIAEQMALTWFSRVVNSN